LVSNTGPTARQYKVLGIARNDFEQAFTVEAGIKKTGYLLSGLLVYDPVFCFFNASPAGLWYRSKYFLHNVLRVREGL